MCGIIGYAGPRQAAAILLDGLSRIEYRGYDSAGLAIQNGSGLELRKVAGRLSGLADLVNESPINGTSGIAHTRWATHGAPNQTNAHPHIDTHGSVALVHNGIIENAETLRRMLTKRGYEFRTETDTETVAFLIEDAPDGPLEDRVAAALQLMEGAYGLVVMCDKEPGKLVVARQGSPAILGVGDNEYFVASDPSAILEHTRSVVYLDDGDLAVITPDGYKVFDADAREMERPVSDLDWDIEAIELNGFDHFMLKEIFEQPETVRATLRGRLMFDEGTARLNGLNLTPEQLDSIERIRILACGTSWHSALVGRYMIEGLAGIPVDVEYASEFRYRRLIETPNTITIAISQSGETADTLEAMKAARQIESPLYGIVNVVGSAIARESDGGVYLHAGPEIGVASTKAFTSQITALLMLAMKLGRRKGLSLDEGRDIIHEMARLPEMIKRTLNTDEVAKEVASVFAGASNFLYLGRGVNFPVALEGALKLKEISYVHAEGYPAAEMKHGPIALIDEEMPVVFVAPSDHLFGKVLSNMREVHARGGRIIAITTEGAEGLEGLAEYVIEVPKTSDYLSPILTSIPLQLLAYHIAVLRGCDVDKPRNLAKSVTVE